MSVENIGRYEIVRELGRGGMATVYEAYDPRVKRNVALKLLAAGYGQDLEFRARFKQEAAVIGELDHPNIVPIYDYGEHEERPFIVMRLMPGGTVDDMLKKQGKLQIGDVAEIMLRVCDVLDDAHKADIIHRDIKPANILLDSDGNAFLADFGIVKVAGQDMDLTAGAIMGTFAYLSPEQVYGDGEVTYLSDVYALGVTFYELLVGERPYQADTPPKLMMRHVMDPVPDILEANPDLPSGAKQVVLMSMAKDASARYQSAGAFAEAVEKVSRQIPSSGKRRRRGEQADALFSVFDDMDDGDGE